MDFSILLSGGVLVAVIATLLAVLSIGKGKPVSEVVTEAQRLANLMIEVASHVKAAQQTLWDKSGVEKMDWVLARLEELFPDLDIEYLRTKVEAAVHDMKSGNAGLVVGEITTKPSSIRRQPKKRGNAGLVVGEITTSEPGEVTASRAASIL